MSKRGLVSVIIPVYNVRPYLKEALDSVVNQTYKKLEILIIDDGSSDGSDEICDIYANKDERIIVIHQENKGLSAARNKGLELMSGETVVFLDSDDAYHPCYVEKMLAEFNRNNIDMVVCKYYVHETLEKLKCVGHGMMVAPSIEQGLYDRISILQALADGSLNHSVWNKLYRASLWSTVRYPIGHVYEDRDTTYKIANECRKVCVLNEPLYYRRERSGSISKTYSQNNINDWIESFSHFEKFIIRNIPSVFSEEQLENSRRIKVNQLINFYVFYSQKEKSYGNEKKKAFVDKIRTQTIITGKLIRMRGSSHFTRICYWMMVYCPLLLRVVYPMFHKIWYLANRISIYCLN